MVNAEEHWITARAQRGQMAPGAWSKFGAPCSNLRSFGSNYTALQYSTYDIVRTFRRPAVIRRPHCDFAPGELCPCPHRYARDYCARRASTKPWYTALTGGIREPWASGGKNDQFARIFAPLWGKQIGKFCRAMVLLATCPSIDQFFLKFFVSCPNLPPLRTPIALTQKLCQNTSFLQLGGLIDWFYVVITIFAQHLNIFSPKLGNDGAVCRHLATHQANVTDGCVVLILLLQLETRR